MEILHRYRMDEAAASICLLSWSQWSLRSIDGKKTAVAILSVADGEGRIWVLDVAQLIDAPHPTFAHLLEDNTQDENVEDIWASDPFLVCGPGGSPATQITWIEQEQGLVSQA